MSYNRLILAAEIQIIIIIAKKSKNIWIKHYNLFFNQGSFDILNILL